jgi:hypothetical protein
MICYPWFSFDDFLGFFLDIRGGVELVALGL